MNDLKNITKLLGEQDKKLSKILEILELQKNERLESSKIKTMSETHSKKEIQLEKNKNKPKYPINNLYHNDFFKTAKTLGEVAKKLDDDGFHFKSGSIQYALDSAKYLNRKGGKGNYRWIQKYPPN